MSYPQYPGSGAGPAFYAGQPWPGAKANGVTAIIAAVLAILGGLMCLLNAVITAQGLFEAAHFPLLAFRFAGLVLLVLAMLTGAGLLFARKPIGQKLVVGSSAFAIVLFVVLSI